MKSEAWHRVFLLLVTLATLISLIMGIKGAKVYIDSNRSVLRDLSNVDRLHLEEGKLQGLVPDRCRI